MVSIGGGSRKKKSKSSSTSTESREFNRPFFEQAYGFFGGDPGYDPEYVGFSDFERLEDTLYGTQQAKVSDAYRQAKKQRAEELSLTGLLNSPSRYIEGGVDDTLDKHLVSSLQQAARDAAYGRLTAEQGEARRRTDFNTQTADRVLAAFLDKLRLAVEAANRTATGTKTARERGSSFGFNTGLSF